MFRIWGKIIKDNHMIADHTYEEDSDDTRTHKVFRALDTFVHLWDLEKPIWLDTNIREFKRSAKTRFTPDSFLEQVPFDYLEIHVIEED